MRPNRGLLIVGAVLVAGAVALASYAARPDAATAQQAEQSEAGAWQIDREMTVQPAAAPRRALKHRLLPPALDRQRGNAAALYREAFEALEGAEEEPGFDREALLNVPDHSMEQLRGEAGDEAHELLERLEPILSQVADASRRDTCDWALPTREKGILSRLEAVASSRAVTKYFNARIRLAIAEGRAEHAMDDVQTVVAMADHINKKDTLVSSLVAMANFGLLLDHLATMLEMPEAPNLYWALSTLPSPLLSMRDLLEFEEGMLFWSLPERDIQAWRDGNVSVETVIESMETALELPIDIGAPRLEGLPRGQRRWHVIRGIVQTHERAREKLRERGWDKEEVEKLDMHEAVVAYQVAVIEEVRDDFMKWQYLPLEERPLDVAGRIEDRYAEKHPVGVGLLDAEGLESVMHRSYQLIRRIAILRTVEAVRLHAAGHGGALPRTLEEIGEVPVPDDPVTGEPFTYQREGETVVIATEPDEADPLGKGVRLTLHFNH